MAESWKECVSSYLPSWFFIWKVESLGGGLCGSRDAELADVVLAYLVNAEAAESRAPAKNNFVNTPRVILLVEGV
jgi:hypothetical protein